MRSREFRICSVRQVEHLLRILEALSFWYARLYWFVKWPTIFLPSSKFVTLCPPQGIFALQKSLRGGLPAQRNFQRKFALRRVGSHKFVVPPTIERSKVREHAQLVQPSVPGSLGCQRGRCPSVSERVQRKPFQGFSLGNFFLTADAVLLCAAKKNSDSRWRLCRLTDMGCRAGVGTTRLAGFCQFSPDPWVTHSSKKPHTVGSGK